VIAITYRVGKVANDLVRMSVQYGERDSVTLKFEGRIAGANVPELQRAWRDLGPSLGSKKLTIDLRGVTYMDGTGIQVLADIHPMTGTEYLADSPLSKYFVEQVQQDIRKHSK
jgi:hypothetical protein